MSNNHDFVTEFIEIYRSFPCLWKKGNKDYHNNNKREEGYNALLAKFKEYEPGTTKKSVLGKNNTLGFTYTKERKKVTDSERSGTGADSIYSPSLWYYDLMEFLHE
jgi:Alcohol dehydrogenase transcription factor Myb/SANT-like.